MPASDVVSDDDEVGDEYASSFIVVLSEIEAVGNGVVDVQLVLSVGDLVLLLLDPL